MTIHPTTHQTIRLLGHVVALVALYVVAVWTLLGQTLDTAAMDTVGAVLGGEWADELLDLVSQATVLLGTALVTVVGWGSWGLAGAVRAGGTVVATVVGAQVLKAVLVRPEWLDDAANSLPSGHAAAVAGLAVAAVAAVPPALRGLTAVVGTGAVALTGLATLAEGWHRPSDVIASALLASMAGIVAAILKRPGQPSPTTTTSGPRSGAAARRASAVTTVASSTSASATYAAS